MTVVRRLGTTLVLRPERGPTASMRSLPSPSLNTKRVVFDGPEKGPARIASWGLVWNVPSSSLPGRG